MITNKTVHTTNQVDIQVDSETVASLYNDFQSSGNANLSIQITDAAKFFGSDESTTNLHTLVDSALAQAKANITPVG